jgi:hypothetical protein
VDAKRLAYGSRMDHNGAANESFLWELLAPTSIKYTSFDIVEGSKTEVFDLNFHELPVRHKSAHDLVLNFGTTEHVINQYNALKVIHEATKPGGHMFHQVPSTGCIDHGYFVYSPKLFYHLASANGYKLVDLWLSGPQVSHTIFDTINYELDLITNRQRPYNNVEAWKVTQIPNSVVNVLLRKQFDRPFTLALDISTSVGKPVIDYGSI